MGNVLSSCVKDDAALKADRSTASSGSNISPGPRNASPPTKPRAGASVKPSSAPLPPPKAVQPADLQSSAVKSIQIPDRYHSEPHFVKIIHVGAGAAGLCTAYKAKKMLRNYELVVYEKLNSNIGGTWLENRYPGCACDVPSHIYNFSFEPNPNWSSYYSYSEEIQDYFVRFYEKYKLQEFMRFNTTVLSVTWDDRKAQWEVELVRDGKKFTDWCHVLINGSGVVNRWKYPNIPGIDRYRGTLTHSAHWDTSISWENKRVAVIGSGASAVQLLPQLVKGSQSLVCFARNPTWIIPNILNGEPAHPAGMTPAAAGKHRYVDEEKALFRADANQLLAYRKKLESSITVLFPAFIRGSPLNNMFRQQMREVVGAQLGDDEQLRKAFLPEWSPGCRRITPSDDFIQCFKLPHVSLDRDNLAGFTERGLRTVTGREYEFDLIACATGFDIQFVPHFKVVGRGGAVMQEEWSETPNLYLSITSPNFPNYFVINGPRGNWNQGSTLPSHETQIEYALQCVQKIQAERLHSLEVRQHPTTQLNEWIDAWHAQKSIWAEPCRSWYKRNTHDGRVYVWCGSMPHLLKSLKRPRWEDYLIKYWEEEEESVAEGEGKEKVKHGNMWAFLGNGTTVIEKELLLGRPADVAPYIRTEDSPWDIELPPVKVETAF
ncbi:uncharacterized protein K452DRAFT_322360 [Aplosporella prunicola CBS 121167]|uniref:FAD/NAD(P)-binding domain-containing protein n=1 Tax=Aplosporella prunicola CBS 121167 TaxID=1176127 RepID=A0A6A6AX13_9PEZI|nr:uncharacterized protein K452DRAFT_322360 [Aplosporella prunicola CBS 121167]KAF2136532.1 hypothetical protein K452DRAFT_322360 [Aplosporella prunicola CBS 121167]